MLRRSRELGVEACFFKPIVMSVFLKKVNAILGMPSIIPQKPESLDEGVQVTHFPEAKLSGKEELKKGNDFSSVAHILYESLGAIAVTIIDNHGRVIIEEGEKIDGLLTQGWQGSVINSLDVANKISEHINQSSDQSFQLFTSPQFTFVILPVSGYGFLVILHHQNDWKKLTTEIQFILDAQEVLSGLGFDEQEVLPSELEKKPETSQELKNGEEELMPVDIDMNALFDDNAVVEDADSFWEDAIETSESEKDFEKSGYLNFNQAKQRGLVAEEE